MMPAASGVISAAINKYSGGHDPYWSNVVLLMPMESNFNDVKGHSFSLLGTPTIVNAGNPAPYGDNCGSFGSGNCVTFADSADWIFGTNDYTVEFWIRPAAADLIGDYGAIHAVVNQRSGDGTGQQWGLSSGKLFHWVNNTTVTQGETSTVSADTAYHIAFTRIGNTFYGFINGNLEITKTYTHNLSDIPALMVIGGEQYNYDQDWFGKIKDVRITIGVGRYSSNFTPPTSPYPTA